MPARILLVDDERDLVWAVQNTLTRDGYEVLTAYDGMEALTQAQRHTPDLIVLDIIMPRMDGFQVCERLREDPSTASMPILFLSARGAVEDRIAGLDGGADDYIIKPFDFGELKARIRALLRRNVDVSMLKESVPPPAGEVAVDILTIGDYVLNSNSGQVCVHGQETIQLTPIECNLLHFLMAHPNVVFTNEQLLENVWGYELPVADPSLVRWHIRNLRLKLEDDPAHPLVIRTIPRHGYVMAKSTAESHPPTVMLALTPP